MAAKRSGLGKGLDALIPTHPEGEILAEFGGVLEVPLTLIATNPYQPRRGFDEEKLMELASSIKEHGIIQPLVISSQVEGQEQKYSLIAGERRLRAAQMAGLKTVPAVLREADSQDHLLLALIENVQRADLNPLETATAYQSLAVEFDLSHEEIGKRVGKSRTAVTNTLRLLDLPDVVQQAIRKNQISMGHARALLALPTIKAQSAALQTILTQGFNVRQTEDLVAQLKGKKKAKSPKKNPKSPELKALEEDLQSALGTKVRLTRSNKGSGTITVHYYSDEEFNSLMDHFLKK
ncbi:MAG TPA: ParB/RepB/Spo0J family partition protein [Chloroflexi bacterium]|nr:MAG: stage 0 sporulation protein J [Chloroflexota bacterium]HDD55841.1 ParB/RepB/Spo0J family partition protein [Chloroflexota bacterium]